MIIPSFHGFAATPNAGSAFVGGAGVGQRAVESQMQNDAAMAAIAQRASEASMQNQLGMQRIQQEKEQAAMANQLRQEQLQQETMQKQQELEVLNAYHQSMIGLKQQDLMREQALTQLKTDEFANKYQSQEKMRNEVENAIAAGMSPSDAFTQGVIKYGAGAGLPSGAFSDVIQKSGDGGMGDATLNDVQNSDDYQWFQTGPHSRQLVKRKSDIPDEVTEIPGTGYERIGDKVVPKREDDAIKALREDRKRLKNALESKEFTPNRMAMAKAADPKAKLNATDKYYIEEYKKKQQQLADIEAQLNQGSSARSTGGTTNRIGRFKIY